MAAEVITTSAERAALPVGTAIRSSAGTIACRFDEKRGVVFGSDYPFPWESLELPLTVLYRPDVPARTEPTEEQVRAALNAVLDDNTIHPTSLIDRMASAVLALLPQRVAPSTDEIAEALSGPWFDSRVYSSHAVAMTIEVLYASQPTVAEVKAEAIREYIERRETPVLRVETTDELRPIIDMALSPFTRAVRDVAAERSTHAERGWTPEHDRRHGVDHLVRLARDYVTRQGAAAEEAGVYDRKYLVKAASLLVAAIELVDRQEADHA